VPGSFTAQAFITTDLDDNQITAFHPGAMNHSHENQVADASDITLGIVARRPRGHAAARAGIPRRRHPLRLRPGPGPADVQRRGGQNHRFGWDEIADRFKAEYGYEL
jgi:hypothetical protein